MNTPHKHADVIHAWADGRTIQFKSTLDYDWHDYRIGLPHFNEEDTEWRIKPDIKDFNYRVAIMQDDLDKPEYWPNTAFTEAEAKTIEGEGAFLKWITDWKTVKDVEL